MEGYKMKMFTCSCCGDSFESKKPQDPQRDKGYGACSDCTPFLIEDAVRFGYAGEPLTVETATDRFNKYA